MNKGSSQDSAKRPQADFSLSAPRDELTLTQSIQPVDGFSSLVGQGDNRIAKRELSFHSSTSDLFKVQKRINDDMFQAAAALNHLEVKQEARTRQVSSITEQTLGSTQHSDDHQPGSSPVERVPMRRNLSGNDRELNLPRHRAISSVSNDLNLANHTHTTSNSSNDHADSLIQDLRFADKVRRVTFQGPATPENRKEEATTDG